MTDRLAYLNFVQGSLASSLAVKLDSARAPLKALRDAEAALLPRRNIRAGIQNQIGRIEHAQQKGTEKNLSDLRGQLKKAEQDDLPLEREIELLKRKGVRESERLKWEAVREVGFFIYPRTIFVIRCPPVRREVGSPLSSGNTNHRSTAYAATNPGQSVHRCSSNRGSSRIPPACFRQLQNRAHQSPSTGSWF